MKISRIDISRPDQWNSIDIVPSSTFLQTPFWSEFKALHGWTSYYFLLEDCNELSGKAKLLCVLVRRFVRIFSIAYIPMGPDIRDIDPKKQLTFLQDISRLITADLPKRTFLIRFDPPWKITGQNFSAFKVSTNIQPPDTVILDLSKSCEILLSEMKSKWRYNIKLSEKKNVKIKFFESDSDVQEGMEIFYSLYLETAKRDGIAIHSKLYYTDLLQHSLNWKCINQFEKKSQIRIYVAEYETSILASIIILFCGNEATYLYGASSNERRNLMPAYSLQWQAIQDAKAAGCTHYDFYGIPPSDDPSHPMYGLYRFKTGFGGDIVHRIGSLDIPTMPFLYCIFRFLEYCRMLWYKKITKLFKREIPQKS